MRARGRQDAGRTHVFSGRLLSQPPWQRSSFAGTAQRQEILETQTRPAGRRTEGEVFDFSHRYGS